MLFNSVIFIFAFLPVTVSIFLIVERFFGSKPAVLWVCFASFVFYGYWSITFLGILLASVCVNFLLVSAMLRAPQKRAMLVAGLAFNIGLLAYFKYANFFIDNFGGAFGISQTLQVVLPLGISFYTFQKIALLIDVYRGNVDRVDPLTYVFFISFFPQLIAGPIVHYDEIAPQLGKKTNHTDDIAAGLTLFVIGLSKKVLLADQIAVPSSAFFNGVAAGAEPTVTGAWFAAVCYALQIYFDFSAYTDMAIGLARMFGINLPINFAYKSKSIVEFWRRWHITLSRLLRDYIYISLGGNRRGGARRTANLMITMLIGGAWHGAAWAYIAWGALHGIFLLVNHAWSQTALARRMSGRRGWTFCAQALTLLCIVVAWVPFRTGDLQIASVIWHAMAGGARFNAAITPDNLALAATLAALAIFAPNSMEIMSRAGMGLATRGYPESEIKGSRTITWRPTLPWAFAMALIFCVVLIRLNDASEFIYFQF